MSAPKSSSCQNSFAAIVSSSKSASASASGISINSQQQSSFNQPSNIRSYSPNSLISKPQSRLPLSVIDTNVVKSNVSAPKAGSPKNSSAAIITSTASASTSACGISRDIQQSNTNNHLSTSQSSSTARSNLPLSVPNTGVVKHNVSASRICSSQNSSAAISVSMAPTSATASGISDDQQRTQPSQASTSSADLSSISSIAPVSEIKHAPDTLSSRELFAAPQTQRTKQEDLSIHRSKARLRILFSRRASLNPQTTSSSSTHSSSSSSTSIAVLEIAPRLSAGDVMVL